MSTSEWHDFFVADGITDHRERFLTTFGRWIRRSKLNSIQGLDAFTHVTQTNGTSEAFQMFIQRHCNKRLRFFKGDFMMHKVTSNNMNAKWDWIYNFGQINQGDAVIISCPFSDTGGVKDEMNQLLEWCTSKQVPVLIDMAYFGMCYGITIDVDQPCVEEVTFSLGKTFPIIGARAGIRLQKTLVDDAVLFANQHGIVNNFGAMIGLTCIETWDSDYIVRKYKDTQLQVCDILDVDASKCIIFATSEDETWQTLNRGNKSSRLCIAEDIILHHDKDSN